MVNLIRKRRRRRKRKIKFSKIVVTICVSFIVLYTIAQTILSTYLQIEITPTLTTCVYAFFGTELAATAVIRIFDRENKEAEIKANKKISKTMESNNDFNNSVG